MLRSCSSLSVNWAVNSPAWSYYVWSPGCLEGHRRSVVFTPIVFLTVTVSLEFNLHTWKKKSMAKNKAGHNRKINIFQNTQEKNRHSLFLICSSGQNPQLFPLCLFSIACGQGFCREQQEIYKFKKFHIQFKFWPASIIFF